MVNEPEPAVRNVINATNVTGNVVQAGNIGTLKVTAVAPAVDPLDAAVRRVAQATTVVWHRASRTWQIDSEAPVRVSWLRDDTQSVRTKRPSLSDKVITELYDELYDQPGKRQLVLLGEGGTGKSTAMYLLLNEALNRRKRNLAERRGECLPVPVWLTLGSWDSDKYTLTEYARTALMALPTPWHRKRISARIADQLIKEGRVALFLDGLDEMSDKRLRRKALEHIDRVAADDVRIVLTSRPNTRGFQDVRLQWPVVVRLQPVEPKAAAEFLVSCHLGANEQPWRDFAEYLTSNPDSPVTQALRRPLTLNLARQAFPDAGTATAKPLDLVHPNLDTANKITTLLMDRFLDMAYSTSGEPDHTREIKRAESRHAKERATVTWLAQQMGKNRDLAWWQIPAWVPLPQLRWRSGLLVAGPVLAITLVGSLLAGWNTPWWWQLLLPATLAFGMIYKVTPAALRRPPETMTWLWPSRTQLRRIAVDVPVASCAAVAVIYSMDYGRHLSLWLVGGLISMLAMSGVSGALTGASTVTVIDKPGITAHNAFRTDLRRTVITAAVSAAVVGSLSALLAPLDRNVILALPWSIAMSLAGGWALGLGPAWLLAVACPPIPGPNRSARLMPAVQAALDKQVLRQAGLTYQFRHVELQTHLQNTARD